MRRTLAKKSPLLRAIRGLREGVVDVVERDVHDDVVGVGRVDAVANAWNELTMDLEGDGDAASLEDGHRTHAIDSERPRLDEQAVVDAGAAGEERRACVGAPERDEEDDGERDDAGGS